MRYLKPLRPFFAWSQLSIPTVYDDSLSYYEVLNKCIFHFNEMLKIMQENYEIIDEAFAKILEECEAAIARCEEAAARAEAAQSAAEKAQAAAEAAQAAAEAAQKLAEAAQAAAEAARDDAVAAQKAAEAAQAAAEAAQAAAEAAKQKAETAQAAAEAAQAKAEDAQEKAESARDAAQAAQTAAEAAQQKAEEAQTAAESARDAAEAAQRGAEAAQEAAEASEQAAADSAADAAASAEEIKNALDNYYDKTESDATFVKKAGDTMTGNLVMNTKDNPNNGTVYLDGAATRFRTIYLEGNQDFNNLILNGIYYRTSITSGDKNYPSTLDGKNFILIVIAGTSNKIVKQIFFSYDTTQGIYIRFSYLNQDEINFGSWKKIATTAEINNSLSGYLPLTGGNMTGNITMSGNAQLIGNASTSNTWKYSTAEVTDLNDLKRGGIYRLNGANISNSPSTTYFDIIVLTNHENNLYTQIAITNVFLADVYLRVGNNESFGKWIKFSKANDLNNYLPLSGGTMTGNILGSKNSFTSLSNSAYFDGFSSGLIIHPVPTGNPDINSVTEPGIYYTVNAGDNFSNIPEDVTNFSWYMITKYPSGGISVLLHNFSNGKTYVTKGGTNESNKITPEKWVRLDNVTEEPTNGTPIFYKRVYSTDNKFFANIYKIAGNERKAKVDIYVNNLDSGFNLSFSTDYETFPAIFKIEGTQSTFNGENLPFELKTTMDLVVGNYMVEKSSKYIGLVNLNYTISFSGYDSYIKPYFNGILLESSVLNRGTISGNNPIFITSFINDVNSRWTWD